MNLSEDLSSRFYTYRETAELLHVSESWLRQLVSAGRIRYCKLGRNVRFRPEDIIEIVEVVSPTKGGER